ncbi:unnamed protein product (macronuclear) [Paramecium tetraurelia]|uniref:Uncharacterized protein n=1 Tax=Paramecium tetraurelia TaxID=5888 RepID=A0EGQ8_PARTE|nr:uncharacterized protein GSPATT00026823001 [Paramecium tetraurelia]CAK94499.1 unnamed protein product [Paramecium tetraurelia]|eukprot:XP_001461872.1 hypothetical protein (macronuclear) [Paramecium tetraurelia strain d4-2]
MQNLTMIENENDLVCSLHKQPAVMVNLDSQLDLNYRLLCNQCIDFVEPGSKVVGFKKAVQMMEEKRMIIQQFLENMIDVDFKHVEQLYNQIMALKQQLVLSLDQRKQQTDQNEKINLQNQIKKINNAWSTKFKLYLGQFQQYPQYQKCQEILNEINQSDDSIQQKGLGPTKLVRIDESTEQQEKCKAIAFDPTGKIMISTSDNDIKVWNFEQGKITLINTLQGHQKHIYCLIYSKVQNCFVSGASDDTIRLWKGQNNNQWESSQEYQEHKDPIYCLILTEKEDQLISGSIDQSIKVWMVDFNENKLQCLYSLVEHTAFVVSLSLNESEQDLVSCGFDGTIIIWRKGQNNQWKFQQVVTNSLQEQGRHVKFLNESSFIWLAYKSNYVCVFESSEGVYQENIEKRVEFKKDNQAQINWPYFPVVYNKDRNLLCLRHIFHICILKLERNGRLSIIEELDYQNQGSYGTITKNGEYLVFWGGKENKYETYEIKYE